MITSGGLEVTDLYHVIGKKWTYSLVHDFPNNSYLGYNDIERRYKKRIHPTLLSKRLKELEKFGIIESFEHESKKKYRLTSKGLLFREIFNEIDCLFE